MRVYTPLTTPLATTLATTLAIVAFAAPATGQSAPQIARSADGVVVSAQPLAASAGARMLELGGNAADAAVAAAFAIAVVEPSMNSIGGRNQILIRSADGNVAGIDGTTSVPLGYDPETAPSASFGYATVGVPGSVAGLMRLHEKYGSLPLATVMAPAIDYAEHGFRLLPGEARRHAGARARISASEGAKRYYLKADGSSHGAGERLVQADMARTFKAIALGGAEAFYRGEIARQIAADMADNGGFVTEEALAAYEAEDSRIVRGSYRGFELVGTDIPASGAIAILALHIAEQFDRESMSREVWASVLAQAMGLAMAEYGRTSSDSSAARVTSKEFARQLAERVEVSAGADMGSGADMGPGAETGPSAATGSRAGLRLGANAGSRRPGRELPQAARLHVSHPDASRPVARQIPIRDDAQLAPEERPEWTLPQDRGHTTHLSTADRNGMAVALTQTLGPSMGSGVATPGLGFLYAVTLGGYLGISEPGERARSGITPFMVLDDGEPFLVLGAAGGFRIISAVVQAVSRVIDDGLSLPDAVAAPRIHPNLGPEGFDGFSVESGPDDGWSDESLEFLQSLGATMPGQRGRGGFGRIHGIQYDAASGMWIGAADPDGEGAAVVPLGGMSGR